MKALFFFLSNSVLPFVLWSLYLQLSECYPFFSVIALQTYSSISSLKYCSDPLLHSLHSQNSWKNGLYTVSNLYSPIYFSTQYHWASTLNFSKATHCFLIAKSIGYFSVLTMCNLQAALNTVSHSILIETVLDSETLLFCLSLQLISCLLQSFLTSFSAWPLNVSVPQNPVLSPFLLCAHLLESH